MRSSWAAALAIGALMLPACKGNKSNVTSDDASVPPVHVESAPATEMEVPVLLRLTGSLKGMREADLAANAAGRVWAWRWSRR